MSDFLDFVYDLGSLLFVLVVVVGPLYFIQYVSSWYMYVLLTLPIGFSILVFIVGKIMEIVKGAKNSRIY